VYDGRESLQARPSAAAKHRRFAAAAALIALAGSAGADPLKPATSHSGWSYDLDSFLQVDAVPWAQASQDELSAQGDLLNQETLSIRRGLVRVTGRKDDFRALIEANASMYGNTPTATINEASVAWQPYGELLIVQAGLIDIPFGVETPTNARYRTFAEQPWFLRAFFPGDRDGGTVAKGGYGALRWSVAAMNGAPQKDAQWKGRDPTSSYEFIARIGGDVALPHEWGRPRFTAGVSALSGEGLHPGIPPTKDQLTWVDENMDGIVQPTEIQVIPGSPGEASQTFKRRAIGVDAKVRWCLQWAGAGEAFFEGAIATNLDRGVYYADPITTSRDLRELGFMIGAAQHLTRNGLVGIRYDRYDADRDANAQLGTQLVGTHRVFSTWAFLVAADHGSARLLFEYDHTQNPLGRADNGMPATISDDRAVVRAQVLF
jgi:hypothetical protein